MIFKIQKEDGHWTFIDKVDEVNSYGYSAHEIVMSADGKDPQCPTALDVRQSTGDHVRYSGQDIRIVLDRRRRKTTNDPTPCKFVVLIRRVPAAPGVVCQAKISFAYTTEAFLLSDEGKTVERL